MALTSRVREGLAALHALERSPKKNLMKDLYILGKAVGAMENLANLAESLNADGLTHNELKEAVKTALYQSLWDLTKVASTASDTAWNVDDREIILRDPVDGLEQLEKRYGWISETTRERRAHEYEDFLSEVRPLLEDSQRAPARTILNDILTRTDVKAPAVDQLLGQLERVHQGELSWDVFRQNAVLFLESSDGDSVHK